MKDFNTNVDPKKFGRGRDKWENWTCVCGTKNRNYLVRCLMCNVERKVAKQANDLS